MAASIAARGAATRSRWDVTSGCCLECAGDVAGALRRVAGVADVTVLAAGNAILVTETEPVDDAAVRGAAAKLGLQLRRAGDEQPALEASRVWWRTPRVLSLLVAAVVLITGLVAERVPGGDTVADMAFWVTLLVGGWAPALSGWRAARTGRMTIRSGPEGRAAGQPGAPGPGRGRGVGHQELYRPTRPPRTSTRKDVSA